MIGIFKEKYQHKTQFLHRHEFSSDVGYNPSAEDPSDKSTNSNITFPDAHCENPFTVCDIRL